jgi:hypothetical protein
MRYRDFINATADSQDGIIRWFNAVGEACRIV